MVRHTVIYYYQYNTPAEKVRLIPEQGGIYAVMFGDDHLGSYYTPEAAADDVSWGHTFSPSDGTDLSELDIPEDLGEWEKKPFAKINRLRPG